MTRSPLAWAKPRHEFVLLLLVALAALTPVDIVNTQDASHFCLSRALAAGRLDIEPCAGGATDIAFYGGYIYSNKAPGMSVLALPAVEAVGLPSSTSVDVRGRPQALARARAHERGGVHCLRLPARKGCRGAQSGQRRVRAGGVGLGNVRRAVRRDRLRPRPDGGPRVRRLRACLGPAPGAGRRGGGYCLRGGVRGRGDPGARRGLRCVGSAGGSSAAISRAHCHQWC